MKEIRALRADEIEVRASQVFEKGVQLLLYKDARVDYRILDETFGMFGWTNQYAVLNGVTYCTVGIFNPKTGEYVPKANCGAEGNIEKEKSTASDAFKRACFNIGIGRELYTKIFIFVPAETYKDGNYYKLKDKYQKWYVKDIYTDNEKEKIEYLEIADSKTNKVVFTYGKKPQIETQQVKQPKEEPKKEEKVEVLSSEQLNELMKVANGRGDLVVRVANDIGYDNPRKVKVEDFEKIKTAIESEILMG